MGLKMGLFTVGETVWTKRGTLTSFGVSVRSTEDWVQVELRKKGVLRRVLSEERERAIARSSIR